MTTTLDHTAASLDNWVHALGTGSLPGGPAPVHDNSAEDFAASLIASVRDVATTRPTLVATANKGLLPAETPDPSVIDKDWLTSVLDVVEKVAPVVIAAVTKDFTPASQTFEQVMETVPTARRADKDWVEFTAQLLNTIVPAIQGVMQGAKAFEAAQVPELTVPAEADKDWLSDALNVVKQVAPIALSIVAAVA